MKKSLVGKLASEALELGKISGGVDDGISDKSRAIALALNIASLPTLGLANLSYLYQGKNFLCQGNNLKEVLLGGLISLAYNNALLLQGTQTDARGKKIKKWW